MTTGASARVALVPTGALLLGGDEVAIEVVVGEGCALEIVETAGTVAYPGPRASWSVRASVAAGGLLVWAGLPFVVCSGADVERDTTLYLADGARCVLRETLVLGRAGERGGSLRQRTVATLAGSPALVEELDLAPGHREAPGVLGPHRVLDSVCALGLRPPPRAGGAALPGHVRLDLAAPGALERFVGLDAHASRLAATAEAWASQAARRAAAA